MFHLLYLCMLTNTKALAAFFLSSNSHRQHSCCQGHSPSASHSFCFLFSSKPSNVCTIFFSLVSSSLCATTFPPSTATIVPFSSSCLCYPFPSRTACKQQHAARAFFYFFPAFFSPSHCKLNRGRASISSEQSLEATRMPLLEQQKKNRAPLATNGTIFISVQQPLLVTLLSSSNRNCSLFSSSMVALVSSYSRNLPLSTHGQPWPAVNPAFRNRNLQQLIFRSLCSTTIITTAAVSRSHPAPRYKNSLQQPNHHSICNSNCLGSNPTSNINHGIT